MGSSSTSGIIIFSIIVLVVLIAAYFISSSGKNLNSIKSKPVGDGQFGDQKWATKQELNNNCEISLMFGMQWDLVCKFIEENTSLSKSDILNFNENLGRCRI